MKRCFLPGQKNTILGQRLIDYLFPGRGSVRAHLMNSLNAGGGAGRATAGPASDLKGFHQFGPNRFLFGQSFSFRPIVSFWPAKKETLHVVHRMGGQPAPQGTVVWKRGVFSCTARTPMREVQQYHTIAPPPLK